MSLTICICTKDREENLLKSAYSAVSALSKLGSLKAELLIIDDGDLSERTLSTIRAWAEDAKISFNHAIKTEPFAKGLYGSRKQAVNASANQHILFIDDDVEISATFASRLMHDFEEHRCVAVGGVDRKNLPDRVYLIQKTIWRLFGLCGASSGKLSRSGFNFSHAFWKSERNVFCTEFLHGCAMAFRKEAIENLPEIGSLSGHAPAEDLVLSHQASKFGVMIVDPSLDFVHHEVKGNRGGNAKKLLGKIKGHLAFYKLISGKSTIDLRFCFAVSGLIAYYAFKPIISIYTGNKVFK